MPDTPPPTAHIRGWKQPPCPRTLNDALNHELRIEQAIGEAWHDVFHFLRCERAHCAFVSTTSMSLRHERSTMPCTTALPNAVPQVEQARPAEVALMIVLCTWREGNAFKASSRKMMVTTPSGWVTSGKESEAGTRLCHVALRQAQFSPRRSKQVAPPIARCSVLVFRTRACLLSARAPRQPTCHRMLSLASCSSTNQFELHFGQH